MTNKEALCALNLISSFMEFEHGGKTIPKDIKKIIDATDRAVEALKKQIPRKPIKHSEYGTNGIENPWECPVCKTIHRYPSHWCDGCGTAVDWSEVEE